MSIIRDGFQSADLDVPVVLPTLNLDFANSQELDPRITFTRGSIGTFVNKNGLISIASTNQPRFDYDPISGECRGLLIEEQRTNLVANSTSSGFGGGLNAITTLTDGSLAPDGSNAIAYIPTTTQQIHSVGIIASINLDTIGIATGATYDVTYSMWVKDYNNSDFGVYIINAANLTGTPKTNYTYQLRIAKPKTGTWTSGTVQTGWTRNYEKVVPYPNGWYRFIQSSRYTRQSNQNNLDFNIQIFNNRNTQVYAGDGTSGIYIWGPQVESAVSPSQAPFETSYIPTSGSTVTRSPDLARLQEPYFSQFFNKYEGTVFVNYSLDFFNDNGSLYNLNRTPTPFYIGNGNDATYNGYGFSLGTAAPFNHRLTGQAFGQSQPTYLNPYYVNSVIKNGKICASWDKDNLKIAGDTFRSVSKIFHRNDQYTAGITTQVFNEITIGWGAIGGAGNRYITGTIKKLQFYPKSLNDAQMLYLTQ